MGEPPKGLTLERIDGTKGYCKDNCKWANDYEQARNTSKNVTYTYEGFTGCIPEIAERVGVDKWTIYKGLQKGRTLEAIIALALTDTIIEYGGLKLTKAQWADHLGIKRPTMYARFNKETDLTKILTSKVKSNKKESK